MRGDCVAVMGAMQAASVDAIVCDPPYGLEFMGKEWDRLDGGLPQESVWKGRRGLGGGGFSSAPTVAFKGDVRGASYGGKPLGFKRCTKCGKRAFSGSPCQCAGPEWVIEYRQAAPSGMLRMQRWHSRWASAAYRVLKPGGHLLAFGGTRTYHRLACAVEDAGFEIRDCIAWVYGSGFPKSLDVSKALDKAAGAAGEYGGPKSAAHAGWIERGKMRGGHGHEGHQRPWMDDPKAVERNARQYLPATDAARNWQGWGTALKPAYEPIVVARKPLIGTVAENVQRHGTGAINVDGCRVEGRWSTWQARDGKPLAPNGPAKASVGWGNGYVAEEHPSGRWPANLVHDGSDEVMEGFPEGRSAGPYPSASQARDGVTSFSGAQGDLYADSGSAARFFYCAKASRGEREAGLREAGLREAVVGTLQGGGADANDPVSERFTKQARNVHPTVKPIALMRWLCRLVTPPGGLVLDPFLGSGTTGCAAAIEGFRFLGIERDEEYAQIAHARVAYWRAIPKQHDLFGGVEV